MSLKEDFQDVAYELARIMHSEEEALIAQTKKKIEAIKQETETLLQRKKNKLDQDLIQKRLAELNIQESEKIAQINRHIIEKKNHCIEIFLLLLQEEIRNRINRNPKGYFQYIQGKILKLENLLQSPVFLQLNASDLEYLQKNSNITLIPKHLEKIITIDSNPADIFLGFLLNAINKSFSIDESWEILIQNRRWEISKVFMQIFPLFEVDIKNVLDLDHEHHGDVSRYDTEK